MKKVITAILIMFFITAQCYADTIKIRVSPDIIDFHVEDINGKISGYTDTQLLLQIPYMDAYWSNSDVNEPNPLPSQKWNELYTSHSESFIPPGKYKLVLYSPNITTPTNVRISIDMTWSNTGVIKSAIISNTYSMFPGSIYTYEFDIPAIPVNGELILTKVAAPADLIKDINTAASLNYIGNPKFVAEIIEDINEIEKKRTLILKNASRSATEVHKKSTETYSVADNYREILEELNEAYRTPSAKKFVNQDAYIILRKDIEYIIAH